ncbi:hypothetical protein [Bartonella doshiae]|uniref:Uncharacterized protein n=2 Tax=Bartonella doshiae TaxID=33044 RepID=A0A380ZF46_BARDO|nr:hypothetical protein [Bartonella doshiae]EJF82132.1 hypothetical protein MCS_00053 [Bartonella doshiae NCTC 12862 = ATCC 700133]MBB6160129.1 hypothetical protein [Bartonella doshiae]SUV44964.1 Uncharacterised protein [Bartonella doshiae]
MITAAILGQIIGTIGACAIIILSISLVYSIVKYLKLYRKAIRGRNLALQELNKAIDE